MISMSAALKAHYAQEITTLATCWKVIKPSGQVLGFTSASVDLVFEGVAYLAASGYKASTVQTSSEFNVDNLELQGAISSDTITDADLLSGAWDYAQVELFEVNYLDLSMGKRSVRSGSLGQITTGRVGFKAELRGLMQALQQPVGRVYGDTCDATLGDVRCGVNLAAFTFNGTVTGVGDRRTFYATMSQVTTYFDFGRLTFLTGLNANRTSTVRFYTAPNVFVLQLELLSDLAVGDTFSVVAGDDKSLATCACKFNNASRYRGFFTSPGNDRMLSGT